MAIEGPTEVARLGVTEAASVDVDVYALDNLTAYAHRVNLMRS